MSLTIQCTIFVYGFIRMFTNFEAGLVIMAVGLFGILVNLGTKKEKTP